MGEFPAEEMLSDQQRTELFDIQATVFLNMAVCYFLLKDYKRSEYRATLSIELKPTVKGYYRRAVAVAAMLDYEGACEDLELALEIDSKDPNGFKK